MPKLRRETQSSSVPSSRIKEPYFEEATYFDEGGEEPLFRHGQKPLHETAYARIAELVSSTPAEGITYWTFKSLTEHVSQRIRA
jgi:hypothetical protein